MTSTFEEWLTTQRLASPLEGMHIQAAFEVLVSRLGSARAGGATDPLRAASTRAAGPHSRAATRRMLDSIGYSAGQRRIVHRLLVGSPSGWPGLLSLFMDDASVTPEQRRYVLRQARCFTIEAAIPAQCRERVTPHGETPDPPNGRRA